MKSSLARRLNIAFVVVSASLVGCTASVDSAGNVTGSGGSGIPGVGGANPNGSGGGGVPNGSGGGGVPNGSGGGGVPAGSGGAAPGSGGSGPVAESAGPMVLRRLTHREFNHTLRDLLGDSSNMADAWPPPTETNTKFDAPTDFASNIVDRVEEAAIAVVDKALADGRLTPLIPCTAPPAGTAETTCARDFITRFGRKAYRRPVAAAEVTDLLAVFSYARSATIGFDFRTSIAQVVKVMLQSPNFLYHWELGPTKPVRQGTLVSLTPHQIASRLSYMLWESMPDDALLDAADAGQLATADQVAAQAQRLMMSNKARTADGLYSFHKQWLVYPNLDSVTKTYPQFTEPFKAALTPEISAFVSSVILDGDGTLKTLLTAPYAFANEANAVAYGMNVTGTAMKRIELNPAQRAGILTQSAFLTTSGAVGGSDPLRRGLIILERVMCGHAESPPANLDVGDIPPLGGTIVTTRQAFVAHDSMPCAFCHKDFDPLGFAFEHYDGIGVYRASQGGQPIDAKGTGTTPIAKTPFTFNNAIELANFLASNEEVRSCVTKQWFRYLLGRMEGPAETGSIQAATGAANANPDFSVRDLLIGITKTTSFRYRLPTAGEPAI